MLFLLLGYDFGVANSDTALAIGKPQRYTSLDISTSGTWRDGICLSYHGFLSS
jgi:hypothetical protein